MPMNDNERETFALAESLMRRELGDGCQCLWEIVHPSGANMAILAGFLTPQGGIVIIQVHRNGRGWEAFAAPRTCHTGATFQHIKAMWALSGAPDNIAEAAAEVRGDPEPRSQYAIMSTAGTPHLWSGGHWAYADSESVLVFRTKGEARDRATADHLRTFKVVPVVYQAGELSLA